MFFVIDFVLMVHESVLLICFYLEAAFANLKLLRQVLITYASNQ